MKKLFNIILAVGAFATVVSCGDKFLTVKNPTAEPVEEYFSVPEHIAECVVAAYDPLHWFDWGCGGYSPLNICSDVMADQIWVGGSDKTDMQNWHKMMNFEADDMNTLPALWTCLYSGVKRSNDVLAYMRLATLDEATAKSYEAQARVLRVFYYTQLWKFWGNIPYFEENLEAPFVAPQLKADEVYAKLIVDLEGAIALEALPMRTADADCGRVTKAMAYMLYAELTMYQNDATRLPQTLNYMKDIITCGLYDLNPDYTKIFKQEGEWTVESIYEINYKSEGAVRSWNGPLVAGGTVLPRLISPNGIKDNDKGIDNGWGFAPVREETYAMYADGDARRGATIIDCSAYEYNPRYQDTGLFLEKYVAYKDNNKGQLADSDLNFNNNHRIYRFAETLLNAAELVVAGYGTGEAETWLNRVHSRAIAGAPTIPATLEYIKEERRLEFVGEGKRYWDLVRWGDAATVLVPDDYGYRTNTWSPSKKYLPIPQAEIDATASTAYPLQQNNY